MKPRIRLRTAYRIVLGCTNGSEAGLARVCCTVLSWLPVDYVAERRRHFLLWTGPRIGTCPSIVSMSQPGPRGLYED